MTTTAANHFKKVFNEMRQIGFLLESDPRLPSVCSIITGESLRTSWWSHPLAQMIFQVNEKLEDHPDVLITKLISGKVTFVHRNLWPEILAIATAHEAWQLEGLSGPAQATLKSVSEQGSVRSDQMGSIAKPTKKSKPGDIARELERRLLIHAAQVHTESGAHAKVLEAWPHWAKRLAFKEQDVSSAQAKATIEQRLEKLNDQFQGSGRLPWFAKRRT